MTTPATSLRARTTAAAMTTQASTRLPRVLTPEPDRGAGVGAELCISPWSLLGRDKPGVKRACATRGLSPPAGGALPAVAARRPSNSAGGGRTGSVVLPLEMGEPRLVRRVAAPQPPARGTITPHGGRAGAPA